MAKVQIYDPIKKIEFSFYMDDRLRRSLDKKVKVALQKKDEDYVICIDGQERQGKCQPKGSKVLMADGLWKNIENVKKGDLVLSPQEDGSYKFSKVINTSSWYSKENYDVIELNRNNKKLYSCSSNHFIPLNRIRTFRNGKHKRTRKWIIKNYEAKDYFKLSGSLKKHSTTITSPLIPYFNNKKNCNIEPYSLGVFLGDGSFRDALVKTSFKTYDRLIYTRPYSKIVGGKKIFVRGYKRQINYRGTGFVKSRHLNISSNDFEILEEVSKYYPIMKIGKKRGTTTKSYSFSLNGQFAKELEKLMLNGKKAGTKFIPKQALLSDSKYRKRLLAGLIDTDGYYSSGGYSITTKSKQLAEDIINLVYSLGGRGRIRKVKKSIKKINFIGEYYHASFYLCDMELPIKLKYKKKSDGSSHYLSSNRISIDLKKSKPCKVYGFELDSPSKLYITDNWMVTHNSVFGMQLGKYIDPTLDLSRVCFTPDEFKEAILKAKKRECVIFDEAYGGMGSAGALTETNKMLKALMTEMGQKNLFVIIILPSFYLLERYPAIWRTRVLFHVFKSKGKKGYWRMFNNKKKRILYQYGKKDFNYNIKKAKSLFRGRFYNKYVVDEALYRKKKAKKLKETYEKDKTKKKSKFLDQRNKLIYILNKKLGISQKEISDLCKREGVGLSQQAISALLDKYSDTS